MTMRIWRNRIYWTKWNEYEYEEVIYEEIKDDEDEDNREYEKSCNSQKKNSKSRNDEYIERKSIKLNQFLKNNIQKTYHLLNQIKVNKKLQELY